MSTSPGSSPNPAAPASDPAPGVFSRIWTWYRGLSPSWTFSTLLTLILIVGEFSAHTLGGYERIALALGISIVAEHVVSLVMTGHKGNTLSAYITGNSVTVLTKPAAGIVWPFVMGPLIAIVSKAALRYRGQHIWNPTNLSFSILLLLPPGSVSILSHQMGNSVWVAGLFFALGLVVVSKARLLHITGTYIIAFIALAGFRAWATGGQFLTEVAPLTGPMYVLFSFFMLTDPKTVVKNRMARVGVVLAIALVECGIRMSDGLGIAALNAMLVAPPIFALAIVGPIAKVIDIRLRSAPPAAVPAPA